MTSPRALAAIAVILALIIVGMIPIIETIRQLGHGGGFLIVKFLVAVVLIIYEQVFRARVEDLGVYWVWR